MNSGLMFGSRPPYVPAGISIVRVREGQSLVCDVGSPLVGCLTHWGSGRSHLCTGAQVRESCPFCQRGDVATFQVFIPIRFESPSLEMSTTRTACMVLGGRSVFRASVPFIESLQGRSAKFSRGKKRRIVEIQTQLPCDSFSVPLFQNLAVVFGAGRFWLEDTPPSFESMIACVARKYSVGDNTVSSAPIEPD